MARAFLEIATPDKYFRPVGRCIFCGRKSFALSKEHVIPFGLAANALVLPKASCAKCAKETKKYETVVLRHMWWPFRSKIGIPTRNPRQVPSAFTMQRSAVGSVKDGIMPPRAEIVEKVDADEYPLFFYAFTFKPAGIITERPAREDDERGFMLIDYASVKKYVGDKQALRMGPGDWQSFCKMLAKIAHAYAIAEMGWQSFRPALTLSIRNKAETRLQYWIGCVAEPSDPTSSLHSIGLRLRRIGNRQYAAVHVRLFGCIGTPTYEVIVGELEAGFNQFLLLEQPLYDIDTKGPLPIGKLVLPADISGMVGEQLLKLVEEEPGKGTVNPTALKPDN